jgi:hypothetical protein
MESRIPLPTDNIYKFYALFGLLLLIFSCGAFIYTNQSSNAQAVEAFIELETVKSMATLDKVDEARIEVLERKLEAIKSNKQFYLKGIGILGGIAISMLIWGFAKWHLDIQPMQDEIARLQLEKLRAEVAQLKVSTPEE